MNKNNLIFFTYGIQTNEGNGKYQIKMNVNVDLNASEEGNRQTYIINTSDYKYPFSNKMFTIEENLHKAIMNGTLTNSQFTGYDSNTGYINVESCTGGSVYYLTVYDTKNGEAVSSSNSENKLKAISVSNIIDLNSIVKFYPLEIEVETTTYKKKSDGSYDINVKFKAGGSDKSKENFKNKKYTFVFYTQTGGESDNRMILQSITKSNGESTSFTLDLTPYRNILGFNDGDRGLYYYVEVEANGIKSPTRYNDGDLLSFPFTNNTQTV
jgi:hypothetical protein